MRLSTAILLLPISLALSSPSPNLNPKPLPAAHAQSVAAPAPTPAARLTDSVVHELLRRNGDLHERQLTVSLFGATAILSNGVICGGIAFLTGCLGTPGTNTVVSGTIRQSGGTVSGSGFTIAYSSPTSTGETATSTGAGAVVQTPAPGRVALAAGVGALAMGLL